MGKKIRLARIEKDMAINELAEKVGVTPQYISDIERGRAKNPSIKLLRKIAKELDVSISQLID